MDFYDKVMTHNNFTVDLVCCKLDRTPIPVSCGQGLSCAAACYVEQAVLCPSQDCEDCENVDEEEDEEESVERWKEGYNEEKLTEKKGFRSLATLDSAALNACTANGCRVKKNKYCCFHPECRKKRKQQCLNFQYLLSKSFLFSAISQLAHLSLYNLHHPCEGKSCPRPGRIAGGEWKCEEQQIPISDNGDLKTYPGIREAVKYHFD